MYGIGNIDMMLDGYFTYWGEYFLLHKCLITMLYTWAKWLPEERQRQTWWTLAHMCRKATLPQHMGFLEGILKQNACRSLSFFPAPCSWLGSTRSTGRPWTPRALRSHTIRPNSRVRVPCQDIPPWALAPRTLWPCTAWHRHPGLLPLSHPDQCTGVGRSTQRHELGTCSAPGAQAAWAPGPHGWSFPCTIVWSNLAVQPSPQQRERAEWVEGNARTHKCTPERDGAWDWRPVCEATMLLKRTGKMGQGVWMPTLVLEVPGFLCFV